MAKSSRRWNKDPIIEWLLNEGRFHSDITAIAEGLGQELHKAGAPVWRFRLSMRTLHPLITAVSGIWERDVMETERFEAPHGLETRPAYVGSPMEYASQTGNEFRRRLSGVLTNADHGVLHEFKARGGTDYLCIPIQFASGSGGIVTFTSDDPDGFEDSDIEGFRQVCAVLALVAEIYKLNRTSVAVTEAYLGTRTGKRVLEGRITRGHIERIEAAILMSDIRGWSTISSTLSADAALEAVNRYFQIMADAIEANGGEILKFIGDSVLAIFESGETALSPEDACTLAVAAASQAIADGEGDQTFDLTFGVGLHFGEVLYGNIGSETRIDFTVLGEPVNRAARVEGLCRQVNERLLFTTQVAERLNAPSRFVGSEQLKGYDEEVGIYTTAG